MCAAVVHVSFVADQSGRKIYYLITKERASDKPTLQSLEASLVAMRRKMSSHGVDKLAMPLIGCGIDLLRWEDVGPLIHRVFSGISGLQIVICMFKNDAAPMYMSRRLQTTERTLHQPVSTNTTMDDLPKSHS
eukprot:Lankesteria_metandrocarpae@DN5336_c1_g2_i10.p2